MSKIEKGFYGGWLLFGAAVAAVILFMEGNVNYIGLWLLVVGPVVLVFGLIAAIFGLWTFVSKGRGPRISAALFFLVVALGYWGLQGSHTESEWFAIYTRLFILALGSLLVPIFWIANAVVKLRQEPQPSGLDPAQPMLGDEG